MFRKCFNRVSIGCALGGIRSVVTHQRLDFLLAMDQLVNSAAKWNYMFGDQPNTNNDKIDSR